MKKKILAIIGASSLIVAITMSLVLAVSPVLAAGYTAVFTINNTSGTTYTNVPFFIQTNNAYLTANSYESTSGLDVKLQNSTQAVPLMPTTYQAWFVNPTILGGSSYNLQWSSANVSTLTNGQGVGGGVATVGGSSAAAGVNLSYSPAQTTVVVSSVGTFTIYLGSQNGYVTSGTTTVTGSPVTLSSGTNTITTTGSGGTFFITLSMPFIVGYNGYATVPETAALEPGSSFSISANGYLNTTAPNTGNTLTPTTASILDQQFLATTSAANLEVYGTTNWIGNAFTPSTTQTVTGLGVYVYSIAGAQTTSYLALYATSGGLPTGNALASGSFTAVASQWNTVVLNTSVTLTGGTTYAIVGTEPAGTASIYWVWANAAGSPAYVSSANGGSSWAQGSTDECAWETLTGSGISASLSIGSTIITASTLGNFTLAINSGCQDVITSGTATVTSGSLTSPITLNGGSYTLTASGTAGTFTIQVNDNEYILNKSGALTVYQDPNVSGEIDCGVGTGLLNSYTVGGNYSVANLYGVNWVGQPFTPTVSEYVTQIGFDVEANTGTPAVTTVALYATSSSLPTGSALASGTLTTVGTGWQVAIMTTPYRVTASTMYALVISAPSGNVSNDSSLYAGTTTPTYVYSTNSGSSWSTGSTYGMNYEVYGALAITGVTSGAGTLAVLETTASSGTLTLSWTPNGGSATTNSATNIGSIPSNTNTWYIDEGNVMPWVNYYTETVSGTEKLRFQPETILTNGTSSYTSGTATFTTSSATVTGAATAWTQSMVGGTIKDNTDGIVYTIHSVESATSLTLSSPYVQTGGSGAAYTLTYYPTATLIDLDNGYNGTIYFGFNPSLGTTGGVNNEPSISDFTPVSVVSYYVPPTTVVPDLAQIPSNEGGAITNYTAGTALFTQGSPQVTGFGTSWDSTMIGGFIMLNSDGNNYTISNVSSGTTLSLSKNYTGNSGMGSGGAYTLQYLSGGINAEDTLQTNNIIAPWFAPFAVITNIPLLIFFVVLGSVVLFGVLVWVMQQTQNQFMGAIVLIIGESFLYKLGIYQFWFVIVSAFICIAIVIYERKPAM